MATLQVLKKKLKGVQSTQKITKAMKTVSSAKFSQMNRLFAVHSQYSTACSELFAKYSREVMEFFPDSDPDAPEAVFVMASNKGMCGGFNAEILSFAAEKIKEFPEGTLFFPCGKKAVNYFTEKKLPFEKSFVFSDVPTEEDAGELLDDILSMREKGMFSKVTVIYPRYKNVMKQIPVCEELFPRFEAEEASEDDAGELFIPDRRTVMKSIADNVILAAVYRIVLETALGSQAATLTAMRSAYDTATAYCGVLETQINRKRQSEVTADVIETAVERE